MLVEATLSSCLANQAGEVGESPDRKWRLLAPDNRSVDWQRHSPTSLLWSERLHGLTEMQETHNLEFLLGPHSTHQGCSCYLFRCFLKAHSQACVLRGSGGGGVSGENRERNREWILVCMCVPILSSQWECKFFRGMFPFIFPLKPYVSPHKVTQTCPLATWMDENQCHTLPCWAFRLGVKTQDLIWNFILTHRISPLRIKSYYHQ